MYGVHRTMGKSFQDQLLQLGLVDSKKAKETKKKQHQKKKKQGQAGKKQVIVDENVLLLQKAEEKKKARARKLNLQREAKLQKRADDARIKQLVEQHLVAKDDKGIAYRFNVEGKIQRIFVSGETAGGLSDGRFGVVGIGNQYEVVPRATIEKIQAINDRIFVSLNAASSKKVESSDPEDPYAGFEVPDDLMW